VSEIQEAREEVRPKENLQLSKEKFQIVKVQM
jgi:hypothetical protein